MKQTLLSIPALDVLREAKLNTEETLFALALPCFQENGPFLDLLDNSTRSDIAARFPDWARMLRTLIDKGLYISTARRGIYVQSRYFIDNENTRSYQCAPQYKALADGLSISRWDLTIAATPSPDSGPLPDFLALWEADFNLNTKGWGFRKSGQRGNAIPAWRNAKPKGDIGNTNGNTNPNKNPNTNTNTNPNRNTNRNANGNENTNREYESVIEYESINGNKGLMGNKGVIDGIAIGSPGEALETIEPKHDGPSPLPASPSIGGGIGAFLNEWSRNADRPARFQLVQGIADDEAEAYREALPSIDDQILFDDLRGELPF